MKSLNYLFVAALATLALSLPVRADEPTSTPRGAQFRQESQKVATPKAEVNLATVRPDGNAKAAELSYSVRHVPSAGTEINLANAPRPTFAPRDPRYETALRANSNRTFEVAPLK